MIDEKRFLELAESWNHKPDVEWLGDYVCASWEFSNGSAALIEADDGCVSYAIRVNGKWQPGKEDNHTLEDGLPADLSAFLARESRLCGG